jgi:hypothetical protein
VVRTQTVLTGHTCVVAQVALTRFVPILFIIALVVYWMWKSPSDVFARHPLCFLWLLGIGASKMMTGVMVSHICDDELHPYAPLSGQQPQPPTEIRAAALESAAHAAGTTHWQQWRQWQSARRYRPKLIGCSQL